ncbi:MAG TPA: hypothetical protein VJ124_22945 [Pyrinomonadaceae bacterium]|nr:hypothetical protein [Pyrinomonadaceae bacterium]
MAHLTTAQLWEKGFLIGSSTILTDTSISDSQVRLSREARRAAAAMVGQDYALTVTPTSGSDLRPRMFFTVDAFTAGGWFSSAESSFR